MISKNAVSSINSNTYVFGEFRLEAENLLLLRNSEVVSLAPKAIEVLLALIRAGGNLVTKQEILETVWADTFVEEANLTHHISALRKALGEDKNGRKFIETIPRRGYRFVAEVERPANFSDAEIIVSEDDSIRIIEEFVIETDSDETKNNVRTEKKRISSAGFRFFPSNRWAVFGAASLLAAVLIGFAVHGFVRRSAVENNSVYREPISYTRVSDGKEVGVTAISSDGKLVAYLENYYDGKGGTIFLRQLETNRETRLLEPGERWFCHMEFSPDNSLIYYISFEKGTKIGAIYSISIFGGNPKKLFDLDKGSAAFAVSPDNKRIAFYRDNEQTQTTALIVAALDGTNDERIVHSHKNPSQSFWGWLAWSPDNRSLAIVRVPASDTQHDSQIFRLDLQTGETAPLHEQGFASIGSVRFSPDGREIFFIGKIETSSQKIYALDIATRKIRCVTNDQGGYSNYGLEITADGKTLSAVLYDIKASLWSVTADGNSANAVRVKRGDSDGRRGITALGEDRVAYITLIGENYDIWSIKNDGTDAQPLTDDKFEERGLTASHDGRFLVFSTNRDGTKHLFRMNYDGSDLKQLTFGETIDEHPDFSPEGSWIVYISTNKDGTTVKKISVEGGAPVQLTDYYGINPTFSPDGKYIALKFPSETRAQPGKIAVISADGGKPEKVFPVTDFEWVNISTPIRWTPDGKGIVFRRERNSVGNLWQQDLDGSPPRQLTDFTNDRIFNLTYSFDRTRLLLSRGNT